LWTPVEDGTAQGPVFYVHTTGGLVVLQALWSDEEGVVLSVDIQGVGVINEKALADIGDAVRKIRALEPPVTQKEARR
jgi:hypothetical protein